MIDRELIKQKKEALIEMADGFADRNLDADYKMLCRKLIDKMSRKRQVPFLSGRLEIWAAAVVYALGQINFLFDKSFEPGTPPGDCYMQIQITNSRPGSNSEKILRFEP